LSGRGLPISTAGLRDLAEMLARGGAILSDRLLAN